MLRGERADDERSPSNDCRDGGGLGVAQDRCDCRPI